MVKFYIKRYPFEFGFQCNKQRAISSFLAQVMPVLVKCVWLTEAHSTCRVGNFDMSKIPRAESNFELQDRGVLDMSKGTWGEPYLTLFTSKTPITPSKLIYNLSKQLKPIKNLWKRLQNMFEG